VLIILAKVFALKEL